MANKKQPILRLKGRELVPAEEDRIVEIGVFDALLPCRKFEISYKIAVLGNVSPTLEFLLRLVKTVPGVGIDDAASFFGYSRIEMSYVLDEAFGPGYLEQKNERLWLTNAGDQLFHDGEQEPLIYSVENRRRTYGFDLLSVAPQQPRGLDPIELALPELPIEDPVSTGNVTGKLREQFRIFFREVTGHADRDAAQRRDLYSIDNIAPKDRFQIPVRIKACVQASSPHIIEEVSLNSWRPDHELADRGEIEHAAAMFVERAKVARNQLQTEAAYQALIEFAPDFFKEFTIRDGLSTGRYWRDAVGRVGEPRSDRKTIAIVGSLAQQENVARISSVLDYGQRGLEGLPTHIISIAPQVPFWGATTLYRDLFSLVRRKLHHGDADENELKAVCLIAGKADRHVDRTFDLVVSSGQSAFPPALELLLIPRALVAAVVHAPIGAQNGYPAPMGFASFDDGVIARASDLISDRLGRFDLSNPLYEELMGTLSQNHVTGE